MSSNNASRSSSSRNVTSPRQFKYGTLLYGLNWNIGYSDNTKEDKIKCIYSRSHVRQQVFEILFNELEGLPQILLLQEASIVNVQDLCNFCCIQEYSTVESEKKDSVTKNRSSTISWDKECTLYKVERNLSNSFANNFPKKNQAPDDVPNADRMASIQIIPTIGADKNKILITSYHAPNNRTGQKGTLTNKKKLEVFTLYLSRIKATADELETRKLLIGADTNITNPKDLLENVSNQRNFVQLNAESAKARNDGKDALITHGFSSSTNPQIKVTEVSLRPILDIINQAIKHLDHPKSLTPTESKHYFDHQPLLFKIEIATNDEGRRQLMNFHNDRKKKKIIMNSSNAIESVRKIMAEVEKIPNTVIKAKEAIEREWSLADHESPAKLTVTDLIERLKIKLEVTASCIN